MAPMDAKRNFSNAIIHMIREVTALLCIPALVPGDALAARTPPSAQTQSSATPSVQTIAGTKLVSTPSLPVPSKLRVAQGIWRAANFRCKNSA